MKHEKFILMMLIATGISIISCFIVHTIQEDKKPFPMPPWEVAKPEIRILTNSPTDYQFAFRTCLHREWATNETHWSSQSSLELDYSIKEIEIKLQYETALTITDGLLKLAHDLNPINILLGREYVKQPWKNPNES